MPSTLQTMIFRYNYKSNDVFIRLIHYKVYLTVVDCLFFKLTPKRILIIPIFTKSSDVIITIINNTTYLTIDY